MSVTTFPIPWKLQVDIWGYALMARGYPDTLEFAALISEGQPHLVIGAWDRMARDLDSETLDGVRVPDDWALYWVTEAKLREVIDEWTLNGESASP